MDQKLLDVIKAIICKGGDIYETRSDGSQIIDFCTRYKTEIIAFYENERSTGRTAIAESDNQ